jgi:stage III sporulation protein AB
VMVWLKTLGICLIIGGFGVWGLNGARRFSRRAAQLKDLRMALGFLEKEIIYMHTPLSRALERTARFAKPPVNTLFQVASLHSHHKAHHLIHGILPYVQHQTKRTESYGR